MGGINFLGITFRSGFHLFYFLLTISSLLLFVGLFIVDRIDSKFFKKLTFRYFLVFSFVGVMAIIITNGGKVNGPTFSVDCIWYNFSLAGIFLLVRVFLFLGYKYCKVCCPVCGQKVVRVEFKDLPEDIQLMVKNEDIREYFEGHLYKCPKLCNGEDRGLFIWN